MPIDLRTALDAALEQGALHFYLDATVVADIVRPDIRPQSRELLEMALRKGWKCTSSVFARMEALDTEQTKEWLRQGIEEGRDPKTLIRGMRERSLRPDRLEDVRKNFHTKLAEVENFVRWRPLNRRGWEEAITLAMTTNIWSPDCIQVATAVREGCNVFVTSDSFLAAAVRQDTIASDEPEQILSKLR